MHGIVWLFVGFGMACSAVHAEHVVATPSTEAGLGLLEQPRDTAALAVPQRFGEETRFDVLERSADGAWLFVRGRNFDAPEGWARASEFAADDTDLPVCTSQGLSGAVPTHRVITPAYLMNQNFEICDSALPQGAYVTELDRTTISVVDGGRDRDVNVLTVVLPDGRVGQINAAALDADPWTLDVSGTIASGLVGDQIGNVFDAEDAVGAYCTDRAIRARVAQHAQLIGFDGSNLALSERFSYEAGERESCEQPELAQQARSLAQQALERHQLYNN